jgi:hypothetical protein
MTPAKPDVGARDTLEKGKLLRDVRGRILPGQKSLNPSGMKQPGARRKNGKLLGVGLNTSEYRSAVMWRRTLLKQMGNRVSWQQREIVDEMAVTKAALVVLNRWLLSHTTRDKAYLPTLRERNRLQADVARGFKTLGLVSKYPRKIGKDDSLAKLRA